MPASPMIEQLLAALWRASWQASLLILLVLLAQMVLHRRLSPGWRSALWLLVVVRLSLPVTPSSHWSVFNLVPRLDTHRPSTLHPTEATGAQTHRSAGLRHDVRSKTPSEPIQSTGLPHGEDYGYLRELPPELLDDTVVRTLPETPWTHATDATALPALQSMAEPRRPAGDSAVKWLPALFWIWLGGGAFLTARIACGAALLSRRIQSGARVADRRILDLLEQSRRKMGVRRAPALVETDAVDSPALFGLLQLKLLLPPGMSQRLSPAELRHVFMHELAHLRRQDVPLNWIAAFLQVLHWFNPIVWFAMARMRLDRELACDALVLARTDAVERRAYGATLLKLVSGLTRVRPVAGLVGISEGGSHLKQRIQSIASYRRPDPSSMFSGGVVLLVLAAVNLTDARANRDAEATENAPNESATGQVETYTPGANTARPEPELTPAEPRQSEPEAADTPSAVPGADAMPSPNPQKPSDASVQLETRIFKVNPNTFLEGLYAVGTFPLGDLVSQGTQGGGGLGGGGGGIFDIPRVYVAGGGGGGGLPGITATNLPQNIQQVVRDFFTAAGVNVFPPNQIYYTARKGVLMVRATSAELDVIQQAIEVLNERRPRISIEPWGVEDIVPETPRSEPAQDSDAAHQRSSFESRLNNIVLDEIGFDSVPLWKAVRQLEAESILQDLEGQGVRMYLDQPPNDLFENPEDLATRRLRAWFDLESTVIRIMPPIRNVRLGEVLEAITRVADQPIQYSIGDSGIVFSRKPPEQVARLETRIFKVGNRFEESLRRIPTLPRVQEFEDRRTDGQASVTSTNATEETENLGALLRKFLTAAGVSPWPPNQVYFGDRKGVLMVRATTQELDNLQMALEVMLGPQPKVELEVRAVELTRTESREMGFDWFLGSTTAQPNGPGVACQVMGILTERQFPVVLGALEGQRNTSTQAVMVVTVQSGLQVRISWASGDGTPLTLDCLPVVRSDEAGLDLVDLTMTLVPGETEPVALDKPDATAAAQSSEDVSTRRAMVWTGQTVVFGRPMTAEFEQGIPGSGPSRKQLFVFVTSTILEPTGGDPPRHHFFDPDTIPPQAQD